MKIYWILSFSVFHFLDNAIITFFDLIFMIPIQILFQFLFDPFFGLPNGNKLFGILIFSTGRLFSSEAIFHGLRLLIFFQLSEPSNCLKFGLSARHNFNSIRQRSLQLSSPFLWAKHYINEYELHILHIISYAARTPTGSQWNSFIAQAAAQLWKSDCERKIS